MLSLPADNWCRLFGWLALGLVIYFLYGRHHSVLGNELRGQVSCRRSPSLSQHFERSAG